MLTRIEYPNINVFSENAVPFIISTDNYLDNGSPRPNFRIRMDINFESVYNSGNFDKSVTLSVEPYFDSSDNVYKAVFDINKVLDAYITESLPTYEPNYINLSFPISFINPNFKRWNYRIYEYYGTPPVEDSTTIIQGPNLMVYKGGLSDRSRNKGYFFDGILDEDSRFTFYKEKRVLPNQPEFLLVYNTKNNAINPTVQVAIEYNDGTTQNIAYPAAIPQTQPGESFVLTTGYEQLSLASVDTSKTIKSWKISVEDSGDFIGRRPIYYLDCRHQECENYIIYYNSFGALETIALTGVMEEQLNTQVESYTRPRGYIESVYDNRIITSNTTGVKVFRARTGYKDKTTISYLQQMLLSNYTTWVKGDEYIPIQIQAGKFKIDECLSVLQSLTFSFSPSMSMGKFDNQTVKIQEE